MQAVLPPPLLKERCQGEDFEAVIRIDPTFEQTKQNLEELEKGRP